MLQLWIHPPRQRHEADEQEYWSKIGMGLTRIQTSLSSIQTRNVQTDESSSVLEPEMTQPRTDSVLMVAFGMKILVTWDSS